MYTTRNFKSKRELKAAVESGARIGVYSPGIGTPPDNGECAVEGPHYPKPHSWYATVTVKDGIIVKVK